MFAMDLNHPAPDGSPVPYRKAEASNVEFVTVLEEFMREVWVGIANVNNSAGANPTDDAAVAELARRLHDMLRARRQHGNLSREEFAFVSTMAWFHLTLEFNSPVVVDLRAEAASPEQRLFKISERVGLPAHAKSRNFFELAEPLSRMLIQIEQGTYNEPAAVPALYGPGPGDDMRKIIMHWSESTGHNLKARRVDVVPNAS
jgi:hypothetical protein